VGVKVNRVALSSQVVTATPIALLVTTEINAEVKQYSGEGGLEAVKEDFAEGSWVIEAVQRLLSQEVVVGGSTIVPEFFQVLGVEFDPQADDPDTDYFPFIEDAILNYDAYAIGSEYQSEAYNVWFAAYGTLSNTVTITETAYDKAAIDAGIVVLPAEKTQRNLAYNNISDVVGYKMAGLLGKTIALSPTARIKDRTINGVTIEHKTAANPTGTLSLNNINALEAVNIGSLKQNSNKSFVTNISKGLDGNYFDNVVALDYMDTSVVKTLDALTVGSINVTMADDGRDKTQDTVTELMNVLASPQSGRTKAMIPQDGNGESLYAIEIPPFKDASPTSIASRLLDEIEIFFTLSTEAEDFDVTLFYATSDYRNLI
jgi:hypothetical protein